MIRFKLDENLPRDALRPFRSHGLDAESVWGENLGGTTDASIIKACAREERVLVTQDLDFSDITLLYNSQVPGIIVLRLKDQSSRIVISVLERLLVYLQTHDVIGKLLIVSEKKIRIRQKEQSESD